MACFWNELGQWQCDDDSANPPEPEGAAVFETLSGDFKLDGFGLDPFPYYDMLETEVFKIRSYFDEALSVIRGYDWAELQSFLDDGYLGLEDTQFFQRAINNRGADFVSLIEQALSFLGPLDNGATLAENLDDLEDQPNVPVIPDPVVPDPVIPDPVVPDTDTDSFVQSTTSLSYNPFQESALNAQLTTQQLIDRVARSQERLAQAEAEFEVAQLARPSPQGDVEAVVVSTAQYRFDAATGEYDAVGRDTPFELDTGKGFFASVGELVKDSALYALGALPGARGALFSTAATIQDGIEFENTIARSYGEGTEILQDAPASVTDPDFDAAAYEKRGSDWGEDHINDMIKEANPISGAIFRLMGVGSRNSDVSFVVASDAAALVGSDHGDRFFLGDGSTFFDGGAKADFLFGMGGHDTLLGGDDDDFLSGGAGNDALAGDAGHDVLRGGAGNDVLRGLSGDDNMWGGTGNDDMRGSLGRDAMRGGKGSDTLSGGHDDDKLFGQADADFLDGGLGNDRLNGGGGADQLDAAEGDDFLKGGTRNDVLHGGDGADTMFGNRHNDRLFGEAGDDSLNGGGGNDVLNGGGGDDTLKGGTGADEMTGGHGADVYWIDDLGDRIIELAGQGRDLVKSEINLALGDLGAAVEDIELTGTADLTAAGDGNDNMVSGNAGNNILQGRSGDDTLFGGDGHDTLDGGNGGDEMAGGRGNDSYRINNPRDTVFELAGQGYDHIDARISLDLRQVSAHVESVTLLLDLDLDVTGNALDNLITLNAGDNRVSGAAGADTFVFADGWGQDVIADFNARNDERIDLSGVTAISGFADLVANHLGQSNGDAVIFDGGNSIVLEGVSAAQFGTGLLYSDSDFVF